MRYFRKLFLLLFVIGISAYATAQTTKRNTYKFYGSLSTTEPDCAADLVPAKGLNQHCIPNTAPTSGQFIKDKLSSSGPDRVVYHNNLNWGLRYANADGIIAKTYTVQLYIKVTNFNQYYTRIVDFSDAASDNGIYFTNYQTPAPTAERCLNFYPNGNYGACPYFNDHTYYLLTITRNDLTKKIDIYVNDQLFTTYNDVSNFYVSAAGKPIYIFRDDPLGFACEDGEANFAYLSFANFYSTQSDVAAVYNNINTIANTADFSINKTVACTGDNVSFNYAGDIPASVTGYTFTWNWDGGQVVSGNDRGPYTVRWNTSGTKNIQLNITGSGCFKTISNSKQVDIGNAANSYKDTTICQGYSFEGYTATGTYTKTFANALGCDSIRTVKLTVLPSSSTSLDTTICAGETFEGHSTTGTFTKTFTSWNGCDSIITIKLTVVSGASSSIDTSICEGGSFEGHTSSGTYTKKIAINSGCDSIVRIKLTVKPSGQPSLGTTTVLCKGDSIVLSPGDYNSYKWQDGSTNKYFSVKQADTYWVEVSNECTQSRAEIQITEQDCNVYFPSAFTPNKDGLNELFKVSNTYGITEYNLAIYNRYGELLFQTKDPLKGWDGKYKGSAMPNGAYVWYCRYKMTTANKVNSLKGTVLVIR
ncbi:T9SS type B sorting domain-containing protein [Ferruginibacter albus]|uniref:T9SS type B sorting domain-containing protein n=1 Tax=Ferruginibacter albus TaxID=2875540 RepID=UPI001CC41A25|nr:T9SS type B sorting domain-containing protein [Ferruginibacter albus]UAY50930.1 gliding motility-associated C-terminal domain-containing protein [Ferruginibacter albus]